MGRLGDGGIGDSTAYVMTNAKFKICPLCLMVSGLWLILSAGVAWGWLAPAVWQLPIALLMGGTVIGVTNRVGALRRKTLTLGLGFLLAYLAVTHLSKVTFILELIIMCIIALLLFRRPDGTRLDPRVRQLAKQMEQCC